MRPKAVRLPKIKKTHELSYELKVKEAMNKDVITLSPGHTMSDVKELLKKRKISGIPIVQSKRLLGIVSIEDLIRCLSIGAMDKKVEEMMSGKVVALFSDEPLISAINKFDSYGFGRFPVLDRESRTLAGIITKKDIIQCLLRTLESLYHSKEKKEDRRYQVSHLFGDLPSDQTTLKLEYHVQGQAFGKAGEKSDQLKGNLLKLGYSDECVRRVTIAALEAEMNLVIYTAGGDLIVRIEPGRIAVNVIDQGPGIANIELAMEPGFSTAPDFVRELGFGAGMGLPNIKRCTDEMKIESSIGQGTHLEFSVYS